MHLKPRAETTNSHPPSLAVVILNWNNGPDTVACVRSVAAWDDPSVAIWVVDNGSQDDSVDLITSQCPHVTLVRSGVNLGFGGGTNLGIRAALAAGCQSILLLNNDAEIDAANLKRLVETLQSTPHLGVLGPLVRDRERPDILLSAGGRDISRHLVSHWTRPPTDQPVYEVDYVPGTVALIRADLLRQVGLLNEEYFFGVEMVDLCQRTRARDYASAVDARAVAFHSLERSSDLRARLHVYYVTRNRLLYLKKSRRFNPLHKSGLLATWTAYGLALLLQALVRRNPSRARAIGLGIWHAFSGTVGGQNERVLAGESGR